jgi:transcription-repair coupling factor (superfamily II helicase)
VPPEIQATISLGLDIRIPASYIAEEMQRLRAYKKIASLDSPLEAAKILEEFADRYGPPPEAVKTLTSFSLVRATAQRLGIESIDRRQGYFNIKVHTEARIRPEGLMELVTSTPGAQFTPAGVLRLPADGFAAEAAGKLLDYLLDTLHTLDFVALK